MNFFKRQWKFFAGIGLTVVLYILLPSLQHLGQQLRWTILPPDVDIHVESILVSRSSLDRLTEVKLQLRSVTQESETLPLTITALKHVATGSFSSVSTSVPPLSTSRESEFSISFVTDKFREIFSTVPIKDNQNWRVYYEVASRLDSVDIGPLELNRMNFLLLPDSLIRYQQDLPYPLAEMRQILRAGNTRLEYNLYLYPANYMSLVMDSTEDGVADYAVRIRQDTVDILSYKEKGTTEVDATYVDLESLKHEASLVKDSFVYAGNRVLGILPDTTIFQHAYGGLLVGGQLKHLDSDSSLWPFLQTSSQRRVYGFFRHHIDSSIATKSEFLYLEFGS